MTWCCSTGLPPHLTYAGQSLKAIEAGAIEPEDETYKEIADIKDFSTGQLSIGVSHTRGRVILPEILPTYQARFPGIELNLVEAIQASWPQACFTATSTL